MTLVQKPGSEKRRICIFYTGGTIGMQLKAGGFAPSNGYFEEQVTNLIRQSGCTLPVCEVHSMHPLLDSVNINPADWLQMAAWIAANHLRYSGFVIVHGTDTMAYTASALTFLLQGLGKPIILTGSMIPFGQPGSDAMPNLVGALNCATRQEIGEVCIYFGRRLLRGCRTTKVSAWGMEAFASPNEPVLGAGFSKLRLYRSRLQSILPATSEIRVPESPAVVGLLKLYPGIHAGIMDTFISLPLQGAVLETYGKGSIPENIPGFADALRRAVGRGCVLVSISQCLEKDPEPGGYQSDAALQETGVIAGGDMTHEAALAKLFTLLSLRLPIETIRQMIPRNLCGELTSR